MRTSKRLFLFLFIGMLLLPNRVNATSIEIKNFLKKSGVGTLAGAGLGILSVAISDRPDDHMGNIARGASIGLYGGIIYGLLHYKDEEVKTSVMTPLLSSYGIGIIWAKKF